MTWTMPKEFTVMHCMGRSTHAADYYERDMDGSLAIIKDGNLVALYPQGAWYALYVASESEPQSGSDVK